MDISVAKQRILIFDSRISEEKARALAWEKKLNAFGALSQVASLFSHPKDEDFSLRYHEFRYQPFWHVVSHAKYVYDRTHDYQIPASHSVVQSVEFESKQYEITHGHFHIPTMEHCVQEESDAALVDGVSGEETQSFSAYLSESYSVVDGALEAHIPKGSIIVPPQSRVSAIMRNSLAKMIKGIQADTIVEEHVEVSRVDLYYYPIYAYQYEWTNKKKDAIVEVDGVFGTVKTGSRVFSEYIGKVLDPNFLFDVGADAAGLLVPGGSIAVKVAKKYFDSKNK